MHAIAPPLSHVAHQASVPFNASAGRGQSGFRKSGNRFSDQKHGKEECFRKVETGFPDEKHDQTMV